MTSAQLIRANLSSTRKELAETFPRLRDAMLDWAPSEGMRTIHGQFVEMMGTEQAIVERLKGLPRRPSEEMDAVFWEIKTVFGLVARMDALREETLAFLDSLDEAALSAPAEGISEGFQDWLELKPPPVAEMLRFIVRHESYHTGQLVAYLWARGDNPYKWDEGDPN